MVTKKEIKKYLLGLRNSPRNDYDEDVEYNDWDRGYDACLDALEGFFGFEISPVMMDKIKRAKKFGLEVSNES